MIRSEEETFSFQDEQFADIQMLRYRLPGFEKLNLRQKELIYCLSKATLFGRDITFDQFGKHNLRIRKTLEAVYEYYQGNRSEDNFLALELYLKQVWFASGIYHHYACEKFVPLFSEDFFRSAVRSVDAGLLPLAEEETVNACWARHRAGFRMQLLRGSDTSGNGSFLCHEEKGRTGR